MNSITGQVYPSRMAALGDLKDGQTADDIVEIRGTHEAVARISLSVQQANEVNRRRAKNKVARKSRRRSRRG